MQIFFFKKCFFEYENHFAVEKKHKKILSQYFVVAIKKMLVIQFPFMEIVWLVFFFRKQK